MPHANLHALFSAIDNLHTRLIYMKAMLSLDFQLWLLWLLYYWTGEIPDSEVAPLFYEIGTVLASMQYCLRKSDSMRGI